MKLLILLEKVDEKCDDVAEIIDEMMIEINKI